MPSARDREYETRNVLVHHELRVGEVWWVIQVENEGYHRSNEREKEEGEGKRSKNLGSGSGDETKKREKRKDQLNLFDPSEEREL